MSKVEVGVQLDREQLYKAIIQASSIPKVGIFIDGDENGIFFLQQAMVVADDNQHPSLYVKIADNIEEAKIHVFVHTGIYQIMWPHESRSVITDIVGYSMQSARLVVQHLEHIARWLKILELKNDRGSFLALDSIKIEMHRIVNSLFGLTGDPKTEQTELGIGENVVMKYQMRQGCWEEPHFKICLRNTSSRRSYCFLLHLSDTFGIKTDLLFSGGVWLNPGEEAWVKNGKSLRGIVQDKHWRQGITEAKERFKLIVCTNAFDATLLAEDEINDPLSSRSIRLPWQETLQSTQNNLIKGKITRLILEDENTLNDWFTYNIRLTIVRPLM